jgi:hypothetical protein
MDSMFLATLSSLERAAIRLLAEIALLVHCHPAACPEIPQLITDSAQIIASITMIM